MVSRDHDWLKGILSRHKTFAVRAHKIFTALFILTFVFSNATAFAKMPVAVPDLMPSSVELSRIGVVAAIQGNVEVMTPGAAGRVVQSGEEIFIGDEVKTDALGHLQILLLDETVFTIGPNSTIIIDKFIYDPKTHVGNVEASITRGVFRYVSGKIAANKPENVTINLPTATIGIRGTIIAGEASATRSMAMLLGPGSQNDARATIGSFVMNGTGENSDQQEHVTRTGFGVSSDQTGTLSGVFQVPETQVQHLSAALLPAQRQGPMPGTSGNDPNAPQAGRISGQGSSGAQMPSGPVPGITPRAPATGSGPALTAPGVSGANGTMPGAGSLPAPMVTGNLFGAGENMGKVSGEQTLRGFETTQQFNTMQMLQNNLNQDTTTVSQDLRNATFQNNSLRTVENTMKSEMIARVATAAVTYQHYGGFFNFNGIQGTLNAVVTVDFNADKLIGSQSRITINVPSVGLNDTCVLSNESFSSIPGNATAPANFQWDNVPGANGGTFTNIAVQFQDIVTQAEGATGPPNVNIAAQARVDVAYVNSETTHAGNGTGEVIAPQV